MEWSLPSYLQFARAGAECAPPIMSKRRLARTAALDSEPAR
jgi:hypothetical protein